MKSGRLLVFIAALVLGGCAGLEQYPETTKDYKDALRDLDPEYQAALTQMYASTDETQKKNIRDKLIEERMAVIDSKYETFEASLTKESVAAQLGIALVGIGVGAAGSFAAETASQMLSAASGGLAGAQAAYEKSVFYDRAFTALVAQMRAGRKVIEARIFERRKLSIEDYPLWLARSDLQAYIFAGSLPGALVGTAADATVKEQQAEQILLRPITPESVTPEMFATRGSLIAGIDGLEAAKAKALVQKIETDFPEIKPFVDAQYPQDVRDGDQTGEKAKKLLKRTVVLTVRDMTDAAKWQALIAGL